MSQPSPAHPYAEQETARAALLTSARYITLQCRDGDADQQDAANVIGRLCEALTNLHAECDELREGNAEDLDALADARNERDAAREALAASEARVAALVAETDTLRSSLSDLLGPTMDYSIAIQHGRSDGACAVSHTVAVLRVAWAVLRAEPAAPPETSNVP